MGYQGWAVFMDCDMLCRGDIAELWALRERRATQCMCVQHEHVPAETVKFLGEVQSAYPKKNWSSLMLLNCARCTALTPDYVNSASGLELHRFHWLAGDHEIGALPDRWNHLVDVQAAPLPPPRAARPCCTGPWAAPGSGSSAPWAARWRRSGSPPVTTPSGCGTDLLQRADGARWLSVVTVCMNRREHLLRSSAALSRWPRHHEHLIVDWSSREPLRREDLPADPRLRLLRVEGEARWNLCRAYNFALARARGSLAAEARRGLLAERALRSSPPR